MTILEFFKTVHPSVLAAKMIFRYLEAHYPTLKVSDIAETTSGGTPSRGMPEYYNGNIPWIKSGELKDGLIKTCDEYISEVGLKNSSAKLFPKGTLLVAMYGANIGKTGVLDFDAATNQAVCAIFPKVEISRDYLFWYFKQQRIDFIAIGKGGAQPNISQTVINNASIVVPKPEVQKKIVSFLERIEIGEGIDYNFFIPEVLKDVESIYKYKKSYVELSESFSHQLTLLSNLNQAILQEAVQGKLLISSPPLKEEYPQGEVVENTTTHPQGEVVENTTTHPQGEVVENTTTHPQGEVVENTTTHPQGEVVENTTTHPQGEVVENTTTHPQGEVVEITTTHPQGEVAKNLNNLPYLKTFRKNLRNNLTPAEAKLWTLLKGKQLENKKFRRQFSVANYILDFYCPAEHLAIELDGQGHFEASQAQYDYERDLFLNHCGIKVLRFENKWVWENPEGLLEVIKENFGWKDRFDHSVLRTAPLTGEQLESGAELLKRIKAEKAKSGKKEKPLPPIQPEEIPFEIPENWVWCRLGEICEINPRNKIDDNLDAGFIPMPMVSQLFGIKPTYEIRKWGSIKKGFTHFANNDVVVAKITPCFENSKAGIISDLPNGIGAGTTELNVLRGNKFVLPEYIYAFVKRIDFLKNGERIMKGVAGQQRVPTEYFYNTPIPLPPLSEQKRIVAEIEKQFALTQQLKEKVLANQQATEQLLKALLHQAFEVQ